MGAVQVKEQLYNAIEQSDEREVARLIKEHPSLLNCPLTEDCKNTALTRSVWRNDKKIVTLLLGMGCLVNFAGPRGITPLMWAAKRGHIQMAKLLIENGANLLDRSDDQDKFTSLEFAIIMGQYEMSLYLLSLDLTQLETLQTADIYREGAKGKYLSFCNYEQLMDHLKARIPFESCPNFYKRPEEPQLADPVIDPRETWGQFFKRNIEFEEPPKVERSELPQNLQPQNRFMGKVRAYINGLSPYPQDSNPNNKNKEERKNIELQDPFMDNRVIEENVKSLQEHNNVNQEQQGQHQIKEINL